MSSPVGAPATSRVDFGVTRDGLTQLRRFWPADDPWAAVLLVHGIAEHSGRYEHVGARLSAAGIDTVSFDLRGYGQSGGHRAYVDRFDQYLDDVEDHLAEVRDLGLPTALLGHSMGGLISVTYAESERPQPDRLVLSAPALGGNAPAALRRIAPVLGVAAPRVHMNPGVDATTLSRDVAVQEAYLSDPLVQLPTAARLGSELLATIDSTNAGLDRLAVPTLVLHGSDDDLVPAAFSEPMERLACVERHVYPEFRHEILNEFGWEGVVDRIVDWLRVGVGDSAR